MDHNLEEFDMDELILQFQQNYGSEEACIEFLADLKWPNGFSCIRCSCKHAYITKSRRLPLYECSSCRYQSSLTKGTIMEGSSTELTKWFLAIFLSSLNHVNINAVKLASILSVTYKTAWLILHKIRHAMGSADATNLLSGIVKVDLATYGKRIHSSIYKHPQEHIFLIGSSTNSIKENDVYIKMKLPINQPPTSRIVNPEGRLAFSREHIDQSTFDVKFSLTRSHKDRCQHLKRCVKQVNTWINETYHGLGKKHLQAYFNEFCYRYNYCSVSSNAFTELMKWCISSERVACSSLISKAA